MGEKIDKRFKKALILLIHSVIDINILDSVLFNYKRPIQPQGPMGFWVNI